MKRLLICFLAVGALALTSCNKNYAEDFVGTYNSIQTMNVTVTCTVMGQTDTETEIDTVRDTIVIALAGDDGGVTLTNPMGEGVIKGTVDKNGLHIDNQTITESDEDGTYSITFAFPIIEAPQNGKLAWTSDITGTGVFDEGSLIFNGTDNFVCTRL